VGQIRHHIADALGALALAAPQLVLELHRRGEPLLDAAHQHHDSLAI
jgi:hypothetical protein